MGYLARAHTLISRPAGHPHFPETIHSRFTAGNLLLRGQKDIFVGTLNVRTLREQYKREELGVCMRNSGVQILGIQEHRIVHGSEIEYQDLGNCYLITSSAWRTSNGAATGGVGMVLDKGTAFGSLTSTYRYDSRILVANFAGNPAVTVISTYSPTEGASIIEAEDYYENLSTAVKDIPAHNMLYIVGDLNAHISPNGKWTSYHQGQPNRNGKLLEDLLLERGLEICNTRFQKRKGKLWTYLSDMNQSKSQIDFIICRRKWRNSVKNCEAYNSFDSIGSDHRVVMARVKLSLRTSKTPKRAPVPDWSQLKADSNLQERYAIEVKNRFDLLARDDQTPTERYQSFLDANNETSQLLLPKKEKKKGNRIVNDPRIQAARVELKQRSERYHQDATEDNRISVQDGKQKLEEAYTATQEELLESRIRELEEHSDHGRHAKSWATINDITGNTSSFTGKIRGNSPQERVSRWKDHFSSLLGQPPVVENADEEIETIHGPLDISTEPFSLEEYRIAKTSLREGKACGEDKVAPEVLKRCDLDSIVLDFCNRALIRGEKPDHWSISNIIPLPKKGDLSDPKNYRGISLSSLVAKTLNKMILNRLKPAIEGILRRNQNGFRPGRSTVQQILVLRRIIEGVKGRKLPAVLTFIDFRKAFDSVHRGKMLKILAAYGIPKRIVSVIRLMYEGTKAKVISPDGESDLFEILAGVLQGDTLAPYLFAIVIDYCMRKAISGDEERLGFTLEQRKSRRVGSKNITDVDFADDIALLSEDIRTATELLQRVESAAANIGLFVNVDKTKVMTLNIEEQAGDLLSRSGGTIENVEDFIYLGSWIDGTERDIKVRKGKAWAALHRLRNIWNSKLSQKLKIRLFIAACESILLYGSEAWTLTRAQEKSLDGTYTKMLRMVLGVSWRDRISNDILYGNLPKLSDKIKSRRLKLAGHCIRHPELLACDLVTWEPEAQRGEAKRGRPKQSYLSTLIRDVGTKTKEELRTLMRDRDLWRRISAIDRT